MNSEKNTASKKRNSLISRSSMMGKRAHVSFIRVLFIGLIALCVAVSSLGIGSIRGILANTPDVNEVDIMPLGYATFLYDCNGNQIRKLAAPNANRLPVSIDQIPEDLQHAVVAIEDERFYEHNGIDVRGILRAGVKALTTGSFSEGASTITQQLLKNTVFTDWTSEGNNKIKKIKRKIQEQYLALEITKYYSKDEILLRYMNAINLGQNTLGVESASLRYFGKHCSELTISECAVIASITQNPSKYNPIRHPEENVKRT